MAWHGAALAVCIVLAEPIHKASRVYRLFVSLLGKHFPIFC